MSVALRKPTDFDSAPLELGGVASVRRNGRGAETNRSGRFEPIAYEPADDGWESLGDLEALATEVQEVPVRRIITRNASPEGDVHDKPFGSFAFLSMSPHRKRCRTMKNRLPILRSRVPL